MTPYQVALAITLALEVPVVALVFRDQALRMGATCALTTTATHLSMHFLLPRVVAAYQSVVLIGELGALLIEAGVYALVSRPRDPGRALIASAVANTVSYLAGFVAFS